MPSALDHLLAFLLAVGMPGYAALTYRWLLREIREGGAEARIAAYRQTMAAEWILTLVVVLAWRFRGRALGDLGLAVSADRAAVLGAVVLVAGLLLLLVQWRRILRLTPAREASLRAQITPVMDLLPRTAREGAAFRRLAVTAGICEEIMYRGFLIWYVGAFLGAWPAVGLTAAAFGAAHVYQGVHGVAKTGLFGLLAGVLYVGTGSLVWPMVLHAAVDLQGGAVARRLLQPRPPAAAPS